LAAALDVSLRTVTRIEAAEDPPRVMVLAVRRLEFELSRNP
jgi:hypothetical protein